MKSASSGPWAGLSPSPATTERVIATSRFALAVFSLCALWLDPSDPRRHAALVQALVAAYCALSVVAWLGAHTAFRLRAFALVTHLVDLAMATAMVWLTQGPASPFFTYFLFVMISATLRWQMPGTLWTGAAAVVLYTTIGSISWLALREPEFELNRFLLRATYLMITAAMLAYLGAHQERLRRSAAEARAADARVRLSRDLHDGFLQSLTGAALQLGTARELIAVDSPNARDAVEDVQALLESEQRALRVFTEELGLPPGAPIPEQVAVSRVLQVCDRMERHWGISTEASVEMKASVLSVETLHEFCGLLSEALANAARHGRARSAKVRVLVDSQQVQVLVCDDGDGFSFRGRFDLVELDRWRLGPRSLKGRVRALGGHLVVDSSETGATIEMVFPCRDSGRSA